jgi:hypothetical protein
MKVGYGRGILSNPELGVICNPDHTPSPLAWCTSYTDGAGGYDRHLPTRAHTVGKLHTQQIERKHLTLRTRIKRLARKTICFSKSIFMHDTVIGLFVNRYKFGTPV